MNKKSLVFGLVLASASCKKEVNDGMGDLKFDDGKSRNESSPKNIGRPEGVVELNVINEENIEALLPIGMNRSVVEDMIGNAFSYDEEDGAVTASYFINREYTKDVELVGFSIVYRNNEISGIRKSWFGIMAD